MKALDKTENKLVATPATLVQLAVEQGADLDRLEKLMNMQERWENNEAKKAFTVAMSNFSAECPTIDKTETVAFSGTRYTHASLAGTLKQVRGLMSANGLSHSWKTAQDNGSITVTCCVQHVTGHQECTSMTAPPDASGKKNQIQQIASTVTYLERYTLFAILGLASAEHDDDAEGSVLVQMISADQASNLLDFAAKHKILESTVCAEFKVKTINDLPQEQYKAAGAWIKKEGTSNAG